MTTREELHALIDRVPDDDIDAVAQSLRPFIGPATRPARPAFIGMGRSGHSDSVHPRELVIPAPVIAEPAT